MITQEDIQHKPGCLMGNTPNRMHRVPIDCVTEASLWKAIDTLKDERNALKEENVRLKARIFDLQEQER